MVFSFRADVGIGPYYLVTSKLYLRHIGKLKFTIGNGLCANVIKLRMNNEASALMNNE